MKVYIVKWFGEGESELVGIFSTRELAENCLKKRPYYGINCEISELELDKEL